MPAKSFFFIGRYPACSLLLLILLILTGASKAYAQSSRPFDNASLQGNYALIGSGGSHTAASIGTAVFDGKGHSTRSLILNAPADGQTRKIVRISSEGSYSVNADGTGQAQISNTLPDGSSFNVHLDFVIKRAEIDRVNGTKRAIEIFAIERESGIAAQLVTFSLHRLPD